MRRTTTLSQDERAIEGLPIRLVIALVVGVASLGIMMTMLDGMVLNTQKEVTLEVTSDTIMGTGSGAGTDDITVTVITEDGEPVPNAQVLIESGTLTLENGPYTMQSASGSGTTTGDNGKLEASHPCASSCSSSSEPVVDFRSDQDKGTLTFDIILQGDGGYEDEKSNPEIVVTE
ncbi:DUF7382 domain-containing protein [Halosimplex amylolyticum]|uniref:DUF7382 domain-containing protein n=1 Tax=Halosimplex amylolyticum TaxID=3396616 RepID=UPI003F5571CD